MAVDWSFKGEDPSKIMALFGLLGALVGVAFYVAIDAAIDEPIRLGAKLPKLATCEEPLVKFHEVFRVTSMRKEQWLSNPNRLAGYLAAEKSDGSRGSHFYLYLFDRLGRCADPAAIFANIDYSKEIGPQLDFGRGRCRRVGSFEGLVMKTFLTFSAAQDPGNLAAGVRDCLSCGRRAEVREICEACGSYVGNFTKTFDNEGPGWGSLVAQKR